MKPKREFLDYLQDIKEGLEKVEEFTRGMNFDNFSKDDKTNFAVIRALEIIGEAARKIPNLVAPITRTFPGRTWQGCGIN
jgi:uncharacterized protein with HEPN domain